MIACSQFIESILGDKKYIEPVTNSIESIFNSSSATMPVLFLLSAGADPTSDVDELARKKRRQIHKVSLGEGQEPKADALIQESYEKGSWVMLQNCHLGIGFMTYLDNFLMDEDFQAKAEVDFRIWMSCEPREGFPLGLLQKAVKVTNEPPKGVRAGMLRTFNTVVNPEFLEKIDHPNWRTLVYGVCFLHSVVIERKKFGPLGWCVPYEYNNSDLQAS
jgi:dynein heavy chain